MLSRKTIAVSESQTTLQELNHNDSLNSVERSFCYPDSVSRMTHEMEDLISTINVDMDRIGWDLGHTIMEVQKQTLKYHVKKDMVAFDCKLADLCIKPFSLGTLMKSSVDTNAN